MDYQSLYNWILFPLLIFCSRSIDVSLGTLRSILVNRGKKNIVPIIGFFEVLLWLIAMGSIMKNLNNVMCYLAWAGGYATGIYIGLTLEERLALGQQILRIIVSTEINEFKNEMTNEGFGLSIIEGQGSRGPVKIIYSICVYF